MLLFCLSGPEEQLPGTCQRRSLRNDCVANLVPFLEKPDWWSLYGTSSAQSHAVWEGEGRSRLQLQQQQQQQQQQQKQKEQEQEQLQEQQPERQDPQAPFLNEHLSIHAQALVVGLEEG
ncbi:unnamed protein product [Closterium sp. NIES-53]